MTKDEFLVQLRKERAEWEQLLAGIDKQRKTTPNAVGEWSIQDVIAHVMAYEQYILDRIREIRDGVTYHPAETDAALAAYIEGRGYPDFGSPLLDDDEPNEWVVLKHRSRALAEVEAEERRVFAALLQAVAALSDAEIREHNVVERVANNTFEHYHEHIEAIRAWLEAGRGHSSV